MNNPIFKYLFLGAICTLTFFSCSKYLDVQPEDRFLSEQVFSSRQSAENALNGIYLNIAKTGMYGASLTSTAVDVLAQYYSCPTSSRYYSLANYNYTESNAQSYVEAIWVPSYTAILNTNLFLQGLQASPNLFSQEENRMLLGEAYGLRAFIAFDLLRLFGPVYASAPTALSIPYPTDPTIRVNTILPANVVLDSVLHDLDRAADLLQEDPVRSEGVMAFTNDGGNNFFRLRNRRLNYYAIQALVARVLLYSGDKEGALQTAMSVINEAGRWFPWSLSALSVPGIATPDRLFSSEIIFGIPNMDMYNVQADYFSASLTTGLLAPVPARLEGIYEGFLNDYRYRSWWEVDRYSNRTDKTFFKYADVTDRTLSYRNLQPLIRLSELYYIVAECEPNETTAQAYLNTVLYNRGLPNVSFDGDRMAFIGKEYAKEFWGEGQLFFYYKRTNASSIVSGVSGTSSIAMTPEKYMIPLPLSETDYR